MDVDVVVCAKNRAKSMDRILRQIVDEIPFKNLIVIYGSSVDGTKEISEKYTGNVFWDGDKGLGAARNLGVRKATSEIVAMIDTDIILTKGWYEQLIRHFGKSKTAAVMGTCIYGYGCKPLVSYWNYLRKNESELWGCHNTMFKRDVLLEIGNFNVAIQGAGEDYDLYLRLLEAGYRWIWDREVVVYHPMSMIEYLDHVRWWAQGRPYIHNLMREVTSKSLFRIYCSQVLLTLKGFWTGLKLSIRAHPVMFIYFPLIKITFTVTVLKELKKAYKC